MRGAGPRHSSVCSAAKGAVAHVLECTQRRRGGAAHGDDIEAQLTAARALRAATSETLRLVSTNAGDLSTVLHGILATAAELTGGEAGSIVLDVDGRGLVVTSQGPPMQPYVGTEVPSDADTLGGLFKVVGDAGRVEIVTLR